MTRPAILASCTIGSLTMRSRRTEIRYVANVEMNRTRLAILVYSQSLARIAVQVRHDRDRAGPVTLQIYASEQGDGVPPDIGPSACSVTAS